ncbi:MAG: MBL fold metallo-hydrolase [Clostridia bacterium]
MIKFYPLFSGSKGNCQLIQTENTNILIDVGVSYKKIKEALTSLSLSIKDIDGIFITHEHIDHCRAVKQIAKNEEIKIYATSGTIKGIDIEYAHYIEIDKLKEVEIKNLKIKHFSTSHDCLMPCGYTVETDDSKLAISTDLGIMTSTVLKNLENSNLVYIESNHDVGMLEMGPYPYFLKRRVLGEEGHLSNEACSKTITHLVKHGVKSFILAHLSEHNNTPELALETVLSDLAMSNLNVANLNISIATQDLSTEVFKL